MKPVLTFCFDKNLHPQLRLHGSQQRPFTVDFAYRGGLVVWSVDRVLCLLAASMKPEFNQLLEQRYAGLSNGQLDGQGLVAFLEGLPRRDFQRAQRAFDNVVLNHSIAHSLENGLLVKTAGRYSLGQYVVRIEESDGSTRTCLYHPDISEPELRTLGNNWGGVISPDCLVRMPGTEPSSGDPLMS